MLDGTSSKADLTAPIDGSSTNSSGSSTDADESSGTVTGEAAQRRYLGINELPVVEADGRCGMQVVRVYVGSAAERAGLQPGDVIHSANGYATQGFGNLTWVIDNSATDNKLELSVCSTHATAKRYLMTAQLLT